MGRKIISVACNRGSSVIVTSAPQEPFTFLNQNPTMPMLSEIGENEIVKGLEGRFKPRSKRVLKGIGDDTSVTVQDGSKALLTTTDTLIEGVHFRRGYTPFRLLGKKALSISLSDIAAMGGEPLFYLVSIGLAPDLDKKDLDALYKGMEEVAKAHKTVLIGGNTSRLPGKVMVATTVLGEAPPDEVVYRRGAAHGDIIFVSGTLGDSALGLSLLEKYGPKALKSRFKAPALKHLDPEPRVEAGKALASKKLVTAMMDISDGLGIDLERLCTESFVGADVDMDRIPLSDPMKNITRSHKDALDLAVSGGEDYELLFTAPEGNLKKIISLGKRLSLPLTPIGRILKKPGRPRFFRNGREITLKKTGFQHF